MRLNTIPFPPAVALGPSDRLISPWTADNTRPQRLGCNTESGPVNFDGVFLDMYGTLTTGDRAAVENVCTQIVAETGVPLTPAELAITWGERFFQARAIAAEDCWPPFALPKTDRDSYRSRAVLTCPSSPGARLVPKSAIDS